MSTVHTIPYLPSFPYLVIYPLIHPFLSYFKSTTLNPNNFSNKALKPVIARLLHGYTYLSIIFPINPPQSQSIYTFFRINSILFCLSFSPLMCIAASYYLIHKYKLHIVVLILFALYMTVTTYNEMWVSSPWNIKSCRLSMRRADVA